MQVSNNFLWRILLGRPWIPRSVRPPSRPSPSRTPWPRESKPTVRLIAWKLNICERYFDEFNKSSDRNKEVYKKCWSQFAPASSIPKPCSIDTALIDDFLFVQCTYILFTNSLHNMNITLHLCGVLIFLFAKLSISLKFLIIHLLVEATWNLSLYW